jgi:hypothetical protein
MYVSSGNPCEGEGFTRHASRRFLFNEVETPGLEGAQRGGATGAGRSGYSNHLQKWTLRPPPSLSNFTIVAKMSF